MTEKEILHAMKTLDLTREEAIEMLQEDAEIERGADPHPLTAEQEKASKAARIVSTGPRTAPVKRERKEDIDKRRLIKLFYEALTYCDDAEMNANGECVVEITNAERQIDFIYNQRKFRIVLSAPRK